MSLRISKGEQQTVVVFPATGHLPGSLFFPGLLGLVAALLFSVGFSLLFGLAREGRTVEHSHLLVVFGTVGLALLLSFFALLTLRGVEVQERLILTPEGLVREQLGRFHSSVDTVSWGQWQSVEVLGPNDRALAQGESGGTLFLRFADQQLAVGQGTDLQELLALQQLIEDCSPGPAVGAGGTESFVQRPLLPHSPLE